MSKVIVVVMLVLVGSVSATAAMVPADGDLWTENSSYLSSWSSGNGGTISYVTDAVVGSYAVQDSKAANGFYVGPTFVIPGGATLDLSDPLSGISFNLKVDMTNGITSIPMEGRIYTTGGYYFVTWYATKGQWDTADSLLLSNFSNIDGHPDLSKVTGIGIYNLYQPADATTVTIDGFHFDVVPEPATVSLLLIGSSILAARRRRK